MGLVFGFVELEQELVGAPIEDEMSQNLWREKMREMKGRGFWVNWEVWREIGF